MRVESRGGKYQLFLSILWDITHYVRALGKLLINCVCSIIINCSLMLLISGALIVYRLVIIRYDAILLYIFDANI